jgi:hypothetical protein
MNEEDLLKPVVSFVFRYSKKYFFFNSMYDMYGWVKDEKKKGETKKKKGNVYVE